MRKYLLSCSMASIAAAMLATPTVAAPWVRSYVVTNYEPAWHFGGNAAFHKVGLLQPGTDCPKGSFPDIDFQKVLQTPWRDARAVDVLLHPPKTEPDAELLLQERLLTYRGFRDGIDVYINPFSAPDPGMQQVTGKIAEGFDLDNNAKTGGFTSPTGERGIDNAFYRSWGCLSTYRDEPYHAILGRRGDDEMAIEGLYTFVIRVSGNKDPMNDDSAMVEVGFSPDQVVMGGTNAVLADYSFRLVRNNAEYSKVKATVHNGVVETIPVEELHMPRPAWFPNQYGDADFHKGRMRFEMTADGNVDGLIGGYRDWREIFVEHHFTQTGGHEEQRDHVDSMGMYYALKRNADGVPDPKTGRNTAISIAYRFKAQPAFVIDSDRPLRESIALTDQIKKEIKQIDDHRDAFYKALATRQIQPLPADSWEGGFYKFYPQQQADGSWKVVEHPKDQKFDTAPTLPNNLDKAAPPKPKQQQVLNGTPAIVASNGTK